MQKLTAACGLVCDVDCPAYLATQAGDAAAIAKMAKQASEMLGREVSPDENWCDGCMTESARLAACCRECGIRRCAKARGHRTCADCSDYICEQLAAFLTNAPSAKAVLEGLRA
jgi:hypothetical protein